MINQIPVTKTVQSTLAFNITGSACHMDVGLAYELLAKSAPVNNLKATEK
jgi:hypothetical protein